MRWKWIAGTVFFLIIALMAAIYVFLYTFDYNKLKPRIARMVKDATGRELNIGGEIDLKIRSSPGPGGNRYHFCQRLVGLPTAHDQD